jgi:hypothetical protein
MKKVVRLTENNLVRLIKKIIKEQESGADPQDPAHDFSTVEKVLVPRGYYNDTSKLKVMGVEDIRGEWGGTNDVMVVRYYSPVHPESKKQGYVVELIINGVSKKKWGNEVNMYEVLNEVDKYQTKLKSAQLDVLLKKAFKEGRIGKKRGGAFADYYKVFENMDNFLKGKHTPEEIDNQSNIASKMLANIEDDKNLTEDELNALYSIGLGLLERSLELYHIDTDLEEREKDLVSHYNKMIKYYRDNYGYGKPNRNPKH